MPNPSVRRFRVLTKAGEGQIPRHNSNSQAARRTIRRVYPSYGRFVDPAPGRAEFASLRLQRMRVGATMTLMGVTYFDILVKRLAEDPRAETVHFLVDTGATYTVAPSETLNRLGIRPHRELSLSLADGSRVERQMGGAYFEYNGVGGMAPVLFGLPGDAELLGVTTLEAVGYMVDPLSRDLRSLPATFV